MCNTANGTTDTRLHNIMFLYISPGKETGDLCKMQEKTSLPVVTILLWIVDRAGTEHTTSSDITEKCKMHSLKHYKKLYNGSY
jgi:hypothetical protein